MNMKKIISLLLVVIMLATIPVTSFAALTDVQKSAKVGATNETLIDSNLADGYDKCGWSKSGALVQYASTANNFVAEDGYTWIKFIKGAWGSADFNKVGIYKNFSNVSEGEGLELSMVVKPIKNATNQLQVISVNFADSEGNSIFKVFEYISTNYQGFLASIANDNQKFGYNWDIPVHGKDIKINADIEMIGGQYYAVVYLTDVSTGNVLLESDSISLTSENVAKISALSVNAETGWYVDDQGDSPNVIGIKNVLLEKKNDNVLFADTGIRLKEKLTDMPAFENINDGNNVDYLNGNQWHACDITTWLGAFIKGDDYMWANHHNGLFSGAGSLRKSFKPAGDGHTINVSFEFKPYQEADDVHPSNYTEAVVKLKNLNTSQELDLFKLIFTNGNGYSMEVCGKNKEVTGQWQINQYFALNRDKDYKYDMTLTPRDDGDYNAVYTITNVTDGTSVSGLSGECVLGGSLVKSFNHVEFSSYAAWGETDSAKRKKLLGVRNIIIETEDESKTGLLAGKNMIYVPYQKTNNNALPAALCAAVIDNETGAQTKHFVKVFTNELVRNIDNAGIEVEITNPEKEYVRIFAFDNLESIIPLMKDKSIK